MGKKRKKTGSRYTPPTHSYLYIGRVIKDESVPGFVNLSVYKDEDNIQVSDGDEFVTFLTTVPLFGER